jgi:hypothetical protein
MIHGLAFDIFLIALYSDTLMLKIFAWLDEELITLKKSIFLLELKN